jgi:hypothetical protein
MGRVLKMRVKFLETAIEQGCLPVMGGSLPKKQLS